MSEESVVLVGGRRNLPQIFVEHENSGQLRFRREGSAASEGPGSAGGNNQTTSTPANYGIPGSYSTSFHMPPPADQRAGTPPPGLGKQQLDQSSADSGYSGWSGDTVRKPRPENLSSSYSSPLSENSNSSFWSLVGSPISDIKRKIKGRQSFIDDGPQFNMKIEPHHILAGIVCMVLLASVGFALAIGINHFNLSNELNGKHRSIQYGSEKRAESLKKEGRLIEDDIVDESGNVLGGKRAAMQFAHNKVKREAPADPVEKAETGQNPEKAEGPMDSNEIGNPEPVELNDQAVKSLSLMEITERMRELTLQLASETSSTGAAAAKLVKQIDILKARKRFLIGKLQQKSTAARVIRQASEDDIDDDDDDDDVSVEDESIEDEVEEQQQLVEKRKEGLAKLSQYEEAVAQLTQLTEKLAAAKTVGGSAVDVSTQPVADATISEAGKAKPKVVSSAVAAKTSSSGATSTKANASEQAAEALPQRTRAPKTKFTNPLTSSLPANRMSKVRRTATDTPKGSANNLPAAAAAASSVSAKAINLKAELKQLRKQLNVLQEAVSGDEASNEVGDDPDYPDLPTFRKTTPLPGKENRSKRQSKSQGGKFRKKDQPATHN